MRARVLMLGAINSPHLEHLTAAMAERGFHVTLAGYASPALPAPSPAPGVRTIAMPPRTLSRVGLPLHVAWLRGLLRRVEPAVVHAHGVAMFGFSAALAGARPLVSTAWGSDVLTASPRLLAQVRLAIRRSAAVTADSPALLDRLVELGAPRERATLVGWGVDLDAFAPGDRAAARARLGLPEAPTILSPRALAPLYNVDAVVDAFARVADLRSDARLVVKHLGSGPAAIAPPRHGERVHVVGNLPYDAMPDLYRAADVCVSIPSSDSAPRSVWEAMACGTPCVLSDLEWIDGALERDAEALVVPIDAGRVAGAIERLLDDRGLAERLARAGRARVEREHDRRAHMARLAALYERLGAAPG